MKIQKTSPVVSNNQVLRILWILAILVSSCYRQVPIEDSLENTIQDRPSDEPSVTVAVRPAEKQPSPGVEKEVDARSWSLMVLGEMTLEEKVAQMVMPWVLGDFSPEGSEDHKRLTAMIDSFGIGGVIVSVGSPSEVAVKLNDLQNHSQYPLLVAADLETGAGFRFGGGVDGPTNIVLGGATMFPSLMAFGATGDPELAYELGRITGLEAKAVGVHIPFAPVLDVNNNSDNPIINIRSFGEDPSQVAQMGISFVRGIQDNGSIATGKHFPGHGDTEIDSHIALPVFEHDRQRLEDIELVPFQAAIDAGMRAIMTAHIAVPDLSGNRLPATLTEEVLTDLLRVQMGFEGIVFTDAMDMGAVDRTFPSGEASVLAVLAGADVILIPRDVGDAIQAIASAVQSNRIEEKRIDRSVSKLLRLKEEMGLHEQRMVDVNKVPSLVGIPSHVEQAQLVADRSMTLIRNGGNLLPLLGTRTARVMSVSYQNGNNPTVARHFDGRLRTTYPRLSRTSVNRTSHPAVYDRLLGQAERTNLVVISIYSNFAGQVELPEETVNFIKELSARNISHIVVSFGSPYLISEFPGVQGYLLAWSSSEVSQKAAADALLGKFPITGRVPISMDPHFELGDGIQVGAKGEADGR